MYDREIELTSKLVRVIGSLDRLVLAQSDKAISDKALSDKAQCDKAQSHKAQSDKNQVDKT